MILRVSDLVAGYGDADALRGVTLDVAAGETVALVGANGAGKSTLLKAISGLVTPRSGSIDFDGVPLGGVRAAARVERGLAHVPEGRDVFASLSVAENLELGAYALGSRIAPAARKERRDHVLQLFPVLRERLQRSAAELSGGQQQMLAIARGLMAHPRLLLLDEPSLGLAPVLVEQIFGIVRDLRALGVTVLIAEQNARQTLALADRGYVLENGTVVATGSGAELLASPQIVERYLGIGGAGGAPHESARTSALTERLRTIAAAGR